MTTRSTPRIKFFGKEFLEQGFNVTDNPILVPATQMVEADNILVGSTLARRKRGGNAYFNTDGSDALAAYPLNPLNNGGADGGPILGIYEFWRYDGVSGAPKGTLMVRQGTKVWAIEARTGVATDITGALVLPAGGKVTFQTFEGNLYWVGTGDGVTAEGYNKWTGVGVATALGAGAQPPDGTPTIIAVHKGRMWAAGVPGFPYRLYYSEFFDAEVWAATAFQVGGAAPDAGSLDMDPFGDPDGINGLVSFQNNIYAFLRRSIFQVAGFTINDFVVETISRQIGCIGHHTIVPIANDVIYASERGILTLKSTDKAIQSEYGFLSRDISRIWNESLDRTQESQYHAVYEEADNLYLISVVTAGSAKNDIILAYNVQSNLWCGSWAGVNARSMATYVESGKPRIVVGREDGVIALGNDSTREDLGEVYTGRFKTGFLYPNDMPDIKHNWKNVTVLASTDKKATLLLNWIIDSRFSGSETIEIDSGADTLGTSFILGESKLGSGIFVPQTIALEGEGYGLQLEVVYQGDADIEIYGFVVEAMPTDHFIGRGA